MTTRSLGTAGLLCAAIALLLVSTGGCLANFSLDQFLNDLLGAFATGNGEPNDLDMEPNDLNGEPNDFGMEPDGDGGEPNDDDADDVDDDDDADDDGGADDDVDGGGMDDDTTQGDLAAGEAIYAADCAACHSLGSYDPEGFTGDLSGRGDDLVNDLGTLNPAMTGLTLTDQELADLAAFLDAN